MRSVPDLKCTKNGHCVLIVTKCRCMPLISMLLYSSVHSANLVAAKASRRPAHSGTKVAQIAVPAAVVVGIVEGSATSSNSPSSPVLLMRGS